MKVPKELVVSGFKDYNNKECSMSELDLIKSLKSQIDLNSKRIEILEKQIKLYTDIISDLLSELGEGKLEVPK